MTAIFSVWGMPVGFFTGGKMTLPASSSRRTSVLHTSAMATAASIWLRVQTFSHWRPHTLPHSSGNGVACRMSAAASSYLPADSSCRQPCTGMFSGQTALHGAVPLGMTSERFVRNSGS